MGSQRELCAHNLPPLRHDNHRRFTFYSRQELLPPPASQPSPPLTSPPSLPNIPPPTLYMSTIIAPASHPHHSCLPLHTTSISCPLWRPLAPASLPISTIHFHHYLIYHPIPTQTAATTLHLYSPPPPPATLPITVTAVTLIV